MANANPAPNRRWQPGQSGNPGGRPARLDFTRALHGKLTPERADAIAEQLLALAEAGDLDAIKLVWDRLEGKPVQRTEQGDPGSFAHDLSSVSTEQLKRALKRVP